MSAMMRWHVEVGLFSRNMFRRYLRAQDFYKAGGIGVSWVENKGLVETDFFITATGPNATALALWRDEVKRAFMMA